MKKIILLLSALLFSCSGYTKIGDSKENVIKKIGNPSVMYQYNKDFETWIYISEPYNKYFYFNINGMLIEMK